MRYATLLLLLSLWACDLSTPNTSIISNDNTSTSQAMLKQFYDYNTTEGIELNAPKQIPLINHYKDQPRKFSFLGKKPPNDWETSFYNLFLNDNADEAILQKLIQQFEEQASKLETTAVQLAIAYVQSIEYDFEKAAQTDFFLQYPYETVYFQKGVCADKSILLSKLLSLMDYDHVLMEFNKANHMAIGIKVPASYGNFGTDYCFIETTNYTELGIIPENYVQGIKLTESPNLIFSKNNGQKIFEEIESYKAQQADLLASYGDAFQHGSARQKQLSIQMASVKQEMEILKAEHKDLFCADAIPKTDEEFEHCQKLTDAINEAVRTYNELVQQYNQTAE